MSSKRLTDEQSEQIIELHQQGMGYRKIAEAIGCNFKSVMVRVNQFKRTGAATLAPHTRVVPEGFHLSAVSSTVDADGKLKSQSYRAKSGEEGDVVPDGGNFPAPEGMYVRSVSTLVDGQTGAVKQQWVKADIVKTQQQQALIEAVRAAFSAPELRVATIEAPAIASADLLTVYPMGDPHLGMYAWGEETGTDFDLDIAERNLTEATRRLVDASPASAQALIVNVGDFFHGDNSTNRTNRSGHALDIDSRYQRVLRIGIRTMRTCIEAALAKHDTVRVINEVGNHDENTAQALALALSLLFESNPRVSFDLSPAKFHYHQFGKNLIGVTHGDMVKPDALGGIMATDQPEAWGATRFRYWLTGHVHNRRVFELPGCLVESFRTLAGKDSWTAASGYRAGRDMQSIVLHREFGERERHHIDISALEAR